MAEARRDERCDSSAQWRSAVQLVRMHRTLPSSASNTAARWLLRWRRIRSVTAAAVAESAHAAATAAAAARGEERRGTGRRTQTNEAQGSRRGEKREEEEKSAHPSSSMMLRGLMSLSAVASSCDRSDRPETATATAEEERRGECRGEAVQCSVSESTRLNQPVCLLISAHSPTVVAPCMALAVPVTACSGSDRQCTAAATAVPSPLLPLRHWLSTAAVCWNGLHRIGSRCRLSPFLPSSHLHWPSPAAATATTTAVAPVAVATAAAAAAAAATAATAATVAAVAAAAATVAPTVAACSRMDDGGDAEKQTRDKRRMQQARVDSCDRTERPCCCARSLAVFPSRADEVADTDLKARCMSRLLIPVFVSPPLQPPILCRLPTSPLSRSLRLPRGILSSLPPLSLPSSMHAQAGFEGASPPNASPPNASPHVAAAAGAVWTPHFFPAANGGGAAVGDIQQPGAPLGFAASPAFASHPVAQAVPSAVFPVAAAASAMHGESAYMRAPRSAAAAVGVVPLQSPAYGLPHSV